MAKRQRRRPAFRPARGQRQEGTADQAALEAGARRLLNGTDPAAIESLVHDLRLLRDEADRAANEEPSPDALARYRRAARELAEAERALTISGGS